MWVQLFRDSKSGLIVFALGNSEVQIKLQVALVRVFFKQAKRKTLSSIRICWSVLNLWWKPLTVLHMINSEARVKMIFSAVALLTEHCFKAGISAINQFRIYNDTGREQQQAWEGGLASPAAAASAGGSVSWGSVRGGELPLQYSRT